MLLYRLRHRNYISRYEVLYAVNELDLKRSRLNVLHRRSRRSVLQRWLLNPLHILVHVLQGGLLRPTYRHCLNPLSRQRKNVCERR